MRYKKLILETGGITGIRKAIRCPKKKCSFIHSFIFTGQILIEHLQGARLDCSLAFGNILVYTSEKTPCSQETDILVSLRTLSYLL